MLSAGGGYIQPTGRGYIQLAGGEYMLSNGRHYTKIVIFAGYVDIKKQNHKMRRIIIVGATSGIGYAVALRFYLAGWKIGVAGRRTDRLASFRALAPERIEVEAIDVTHAGAPDQLQQLIGKLGGMDVFLLSSGIGSQNRSLDSGTELSTVETNALGFTRMVDAAWHYFKQQGGGQIAVISSIAGTKGLGAAPSYSATKRFQNTYIDALAQLSRMEKTPITFTDIRPGFVQTDLLKNDKYPLLMQPEKVAVQIFRAILGRKRRVIIDWRYAVLVFFWKLIPSFIWERLPIHT